MTVLVWIVFRLILRPFFGVVHLLVVHRASDSYSLPHIVTQVRSITLQFPRRAVIRHQLVVIAVFLQAARHFTDFISPIAVAISIFLPGCVILFCRARESSSWQQRQSRKSEKA